MLGNVLMLCTFVFFIFGVVAVQLWAGVLRQRCYLNISNNSTSATAALEDDTLQLDTYYGQYNDEAVICTLEGDQVSAFGKKCWKCYSTVNLRQTRDCSGALPAFSTHIELATPNARDRSISSNVAVVATCTIRIDFTQVQMAVKSV